MEDVLKMMAQIFALLNFHPNYNFCCYVVHFFGAFDVCLFLLFCYRNWSFPKMPYLIFFQAFSAILMKQWGELLWRWACNISVFVLLVLLDWGVNSKATERDHFMRETMGNFNKFILSRWDALIIFPRLFVACRKPCASPSRLFFPQKKTIEMGIQCCLILSTWWGDRGGEASHCSFPYRVKCPCHVWRETPTWPPPTLLFGMQMLLPCRSYSRWLFYCFVISSLAHVVSIVTE